MSEESSLALTIKRFRGTRPDQTADNEMRQEGQNCDGSVAVSFEGRENWSGLQRRRPYSGSNAHEAVQGHCENPRGPCAPN